MTTIQILPVARKPRTYKRRGAAREVAALAAALPSLVVLVRDAKGHAARAASVISSGGVSPLSVLCHAEDAANAAKTAGVLLFLVERAEDTERLDRLGSLAVVAEQPRKAPSGGPATLAECLVLAVESLVGTAKASADAAEREAHNPST
jgi:hypothetical protein